MTFLEVGYRLPVMNNSASSGGMGFFSTLTLIFIVLKLTEVIAWSWWWVLVFVWAPLAICAVVLVVGGLLVLVFGR